MLVLLCVVLVLLCVVPILIRVRDGLIVKNALPCVADELLRTLAELLCALDEVVESVTLNIFGTCGM